MVANLAKSPLIAIFFGALLYFSGVLIPYSEAYQESLAAFSIPLTGYLFLLAFALWIAMIMAVAMGSAEKGGIKLVLLASVSLLGTAYVVPALQSVLYPTSSIGVMAAGDAIFHGGAYAICTVLAIVLFLFVYRTKQAPAESPISQKPKTKYRIQPVILAVDIIALPIVYIILFFVAWYFLHWNSEEIRVFYGGSPENAGFVGSIVNALLYDSWMLSLALFKGLGYVLFALPILFLFQGNRIISIVLTVMMYLSGPVRMLIPTPLLQESVRYSNAIYTAVLLAVFGALAGVMLHLAIKKEIMEEEPQPPAAMTPQQLAAARARQAAQAAGGGPTAKQAAQAVSATMKGE